MSEWQPMSAIDDVTEFHRLASFGLYEFRAKLLVAEVYDPEALAIAEQEEERRSMAIPAVGPNGVHHIGTPLCFNSVPEWKRRVSTVSIRETNADLPFALIDGVNLIDDARRTGRVEAYNEGDPRVRALYYCVEYRASEDLLNSGNEDVANRFPHSVDEHFSANPPKTSRTTAEPSTEEVVDWMQAYRSEKGGSCDWRRSQKAFEARFPGVHFDREYILRLAEERGLKRQYSRGA